MKKLFLLFLIVVPMFGLQAQEYSYQYENPMYTYTFNEEMTYADYTLISPTEVAIYFDNEERYTMAELWFYMNKIDANNIFAAGTYTIDFSYQPQTVRASRGMDMITEMDDYSYFYQYYEDGIDGELTLRWLPYYLVSGEVTIADTDAGKQITVKAKSYYGSDITLTFNGEIVPSVFNDDSVLTGVDNIPSTVRNIDKVMENGQFYIIRNGVRYNVLGTRL